MKSDYELLEGDKQIGKITVSELKNLIKECLREFEEGKQRDTYAGREAAYKQMWGKLPTTTDGAPVQTYSITAKRQKEINASSASPPNSGRTPSADGFRCPES